MTQKNRQQLMLQGGIAASDAACGVIVTPGSDEVLVGADEGLMARKVVLVVTDLDAVIPAADDYGSAKLCDMPDSNIMLLSVEVDLTALKSGGLISGTDMDLAIGTAAASNQTLATTMLDVIEKSDHDADDIDPQWEAQSQAQATAAYPLRLNDSATLALYLNVGIPNEVADGTVTFTGTVTLIYYDLGNVTS